MQKKKKKKEKWAWIETYKVTQNDAQKRVEGFLFLFKDADFVSGGTVDSNVECFPRQHGLGNAGFPDQHDHKCAQHLRQHAPMKKNDQPEIRSLGRGSKRKENKTIVTDGPTSREVADRVACLRLWEWV